MIKSLYHKLVTLLGIFRRTHVVKSDHPKYDYRLYKSIRDDRFSDLLIVFLGGSEGGFPKLYNPGRFTQYGATCLSVSYFGTEKTKPIFDKIELEYIYETVQTVKSIYNLVNKKIVLFGYSKGAELSLLLASIYSDIRGVFVSNPSSNVFQSPGSLDNNNSSSSWTYSNKEILYSALDHKLYSALGSKKFKELYTKALLTKDVSNSTISVENIKGPILILSGKDDIVWPSELMSKTVIKRLLEKEYKYWFKHISYDKAGHTLNPFYPLGGTLLGNIKSYIDTKKQVMIFLDLL